MDDSPRKAIFQWLAKADETVVSWPNSPNQSDRGHVAGGKATIASDLKLYTPFRQIEKRSCNDATPPEKRRKRKRYSSQASPPIDSIAAKEPKLHQKPSQASNKSSSISYNAGVNVGLDPTAAETEQPGRGQKSYEKRRRHKTKLDRYILKEGVATKLKSTKQQKASTEKRRKRPTRREKTGAALIRDFSAVNVAPDRLTVRFHCSQTALFSLQHPNADVAEAPSQSRPLHERKGIFSVSPKGL